MSWSVSEILKLFKNLAVVYYRPVENEIKHSGPFFNNSTSITLMGDRDRANVLFVGHYVEGYYMSVVSIGYTAVSNGVLHICNNVRVFF